LNSLYKKHMKKITSIFLLSLVLMVMAGGVAFAQEDIGDGDEGGTTSVETGKFGNPTQQLNNPNLNTVGDIEKLVNTVINWVFFAFVAVSIVFIIMAGMQFITGGGNPDTVSEARMKLIWAAVGIGIALLARGFVPVIKSLLGET
jgi:hypothetical protein